jgi:hypothetical protein
MTWDAVVQAMQVTTGILVLYGHNIFLVFADLVDTVGVGHAPFVVSDSGPGFKFPGRRRLNGRRNRKRPIDGRRRCMGSGRRRARRGRVADRVGDRVGFA